MFINFVKMQMNMNQQTLFVTVAARAVCAAGQVITVVVVVGGVELEDMILDDLLLLGGAGGFLVIDGNGDRVVGLGRLAITLKALVSLDVGHQQVPLAKLQRASVNIDTLLVNLKIHCWKILEMAYYLYLDS